MLVGTGRNRLGSARHQFHFLGSLKPVYFVEAFDISRAIVLILVTAGIGYAIGAAFLWNVMQKS